MEPDPAKARVIFRSSGSATHGLGRRSGPRAAYSNAPRSVARRRAEQYADAIDHVSCRGQRRPRPASGAHGGSRRSFRPRRATDRARTRDLVLVNRVGPHGVTMPRDARTDLLGGARLPRPARTASSGIDPEPPVRDRVRSRRRGGRRSVGRLQLDDLARRGVTRRGDERGRCRRSRRCQPQRSRRSALAWHPRRSGVDSDRRAGTGAPSRSALSPAPPPRSPRTAPAARRPTESPSHRDRRNRTCRSPASAWTAGTSGLAVAGTARARTRWSAGDLDTRCRR